MPLVPIEGRSAGFLCEHHECGLTARFRIFTNEVRFDSGAGEAYSGAGWSLATSAPSDSGGRLTVDQCREQGAKAAEDLAAALLKLAADLRQGAPC